MQVQCIEAFGGAVPGDVAEVPDGAAVDPRHWKILPPGAPKVPVTPALTPVIPVKEGM